MGAVIGFFWHDEVKVWLENNQQKAEERLPGLINQGVDKTKNWWENQGQDWADQFVAKLTAQGKAKIDEWLASQGLNQYGDSQDIMYTGGTPLFNESTGETISRYSYILQKFPELIDSLDLEKYLE